MADNGNFMQVSMSGGDPQQRHIVNSLLAVRGAGGRPQARKLRETATVLKEQLQYSATQLRDAEQALEGFRVKTITLPSDVPVAAGLTMTQPTVIKQYFDEKIRVDSIARDREALSSALNQFASGAASTDAFRTIPAVRGAPELSRALDSLSNAASLRVMRRRFTNEYKPVQELEAKISGTTPRSRPRVAALIKCSRPSAPSIQVATSSRDLQSSATLDQ
jgi:hypothetical protein